MVLRFGPAGAGFVVGGARRPPTFGPGAPSGPYSAPDGFRWEYVTDGGQIVTDQGAAVVDLVRIS